jgi:hypothetical protein
MYPPSYVSQIKLIAHAYNPSYLGGWDQEHRDSRPDEAYSLWDPVSKITRAKWTGGMTQVVDHLLCKHEALNSNHSPTQKRKKRERKVKS